MDDTTTTSAPPEGWPQQPATIAAILSGNAPLPSTAGSVEPYREAAYLAAFDRLPDSPLRRAAAAQLEAGRAPHGLAHGVIRLTREDTGLADDGGECAEGWLRLTLGQPLTAKEHRSATLIAAMEAAAENAAAYGHTLALALDELARGIARADYTGALNGEEALCRAIKRTQRDDLILSGAPPEPLEILAENPTSKSDNYNPVAATAPHYAAFTALSTSIWKWIATRCREIVADGKKDGALIEAARECREMLNAMRGDDREAMVVGAPLPAAIESDARLLIGANFAAIGAALGLATAREVVRTGAHSIAIPAASVAYERAGTLLYLAALCAIRDNSRTIAADSTTRAAASLAVCSLAKATGSPRCGREPLRGAAGQYSLSTYIAHAAALRGDALNATRAALDALRIDEDTRGGWTPYALRLAEDPAAAACLIRPLRGATDFIENGMARGAQASLAGGEALDPVAAILDEPTTRGDSATNGAND